MITKKLNIGDYIFTADGSLARITKINASTYSYSLLCGNNSGYWWNNIPFNGIRQHIEWFECDDVQAKALKGAFDAWKLSNRQLSALERNEKLVGKAKYFLSQIQDVEEDDRPWSDD